MKFQVFARNLLLAFVLITLGFALGRETTRRQAPPAPVRETGSEASADARVVVYHTHGHVRCVTCNTIETLARRTVEDRFADELGAGRVAWRTVNFEEDEAFAERYDIATSSVVVSRQEGGTETGFKRLDGVWARVDDPEAFADYVSEAIRSSLLEEGDAAP